MINAPGYKVWPRVEDVLYQHAEVLEATVVGVPDDYRGESVRAYVALKHGSTTTPEELIKHRREILEVYKAPRQIVLVDEIPKTLTGKALAASCVRGHDWRDLRRRCISA